MQLQNSFNLDACESSTPRSRATLLRTTSSTSSGSVYPIATTSTTEDIAEYIDDCRDLPATMDTLAAKPKTPPGDPPSGSNNQSTGSGGGEPNNPTREAEDQEVIQQEEESRQEEADIQEHHPVINLYLTLSVQLIHGHLWTGPESHCRSASFPPTTSHATSLTCSRCSKIGTISRHLQ